MTTKRTTPIQVDTVENALILTWRLLKDNNYVEFTTVKPPLKVIGLRNPLLRLETNAVTITIKLI